MFMPKTTLDGTDLKILACLQEDARIPNLVLAEKVALSPSPCSRRVRMLEAEGVIRKYVTLVDPTAVDMPVSVFVSVTLDRQIESRLDEFEAAVVTRPEVMECYLMTGEYDYLLRVVVPDLASYERFLKDHLTRIPCIANIKSSFALKQVQYRTALPLTHLEAALA